LFGFIDTVPTISRTLQFEAITGVKISGNVGVTANYSIGVNIDNPKLFSILQRALNVVEKDEITSIYNRWLAVAYIDRFDYSRFWQILLGLFFVTLYFYYRHRRSLQIAAELRAAHAEVEKANLKLENLVRTDVLTGIFNRLKIDEDLNRELTRYERSKELFSIIILDIDHFKLVNDKYGHLTGDEVLKWIAATISQHIRGNDVFGRWGGEEFLIVCPSTSLEGAFTLAENLRLAIMNSTKNKLPHQTASFGVAAIKDGDSIDDLVNRADSALYHAKGAGRNRVAQPQQSIN
jgi:polar amino acid transport system substrate-binding protein